MKELYNINCYYTVFNSLGLSSLNKVYKKYTSILSESLCHTSKLVGIKNAVKYSIKLELPSNYLLNEFTKHIKKNNGSESLGDIISRFT